MRERNEIIPSWTFIDKNDKGETKAKRLHMRLTSRADVKDFATVLRELHERVLHYRNTNDRNDLWLVSDVRKAIEEANNDHETLIMKRLTQKKNKYSDNE